jgi:hypothetical protein
VKKGHVALLCVTLSALLLLFASCCRTERKETQPGGSDSAANEVRAEAVLEMYLTARERGQFKECTKFLTRGFLKIFVKEKYRGYADYYRNIDENDFLASKILDIAEHDDGTIIANVSSVVEGEGVKHHDAREQYRMVWEDDSWKIDDWQIDYGEGDDWPYDD